MPDSAVSIVDRLIEQGSGAAGIVASEIKRRILRAVRRSSDRPGLLARIRAILARHEPLLSRVLSDTLLAGWIAGYHEVGQDIPAVEHPFGWRPPNIPDNPIAGHAAEDAPEPIILYPAMEAAATDLMERRVLTKDEFENLALDAKRAAFTVARVQSLDAIEKVRDALAEDVREGGTLEEFRGKLEEALGASSLDSSHVETIYRTNIAQSYASGINAILDNPLVGDEFPFAETVEIRDARLTDLCAVVSRSGLDGTGIYLRDDPEWVRLQPPRHWSCRCGIIPHDVESAAARGIEYAKEWLARGRRPPYPGFVPRVPVELPKGWVRYKIGALI